MGGYALRRWGRFARNIPSGEERGETDVFAGYEALTMHNPLFFCERFEPKSHFISRLSMIVRVNVVLNRTVVVDSDWRFDNLYIFSVKVSCITSVDGIILWLLI